MITDKELCQNIIDGINLIKTALKDLKYRNISVEWLNGMTANYITGYAHPYSFDEIINKIELGRVTRKTIDTIYENPSPGLRDERHSS